MFISFCRTTHNSFQLAYNDNPSTAELFFLSVKQEFKIDMVYVVFSQASCKR